MAELPSYRNMDSISNDDYFSPAQNSKIPLKQRIRDSQRKDRFIKREHSNQHHYPRVQNSPVKADDHTSNNSFGESPNNSLERVGVEVSIK
jgi:hypothetical protein